MILSFEDSFFEEEERDGFVVSRMMKHYWAAMLEVLAEINRICDKYNLKYFAEFGTLIGAVRHRGFVPWDDDIDLAMLRPDYEKFCDICKTELNPDYLAFLKGDEMSVGFSRIMNGNALSWAPDVLAKRHGCPFSTGVDIVPIDRMSDDIDFENDRQVILKELYEMAADCDFDDRDIRISSRLQRLNDTIGIDISLDDRTKYNLLDLAHKMCAMSQDESCEWLTQYPNLVAGLVGYRMHESWYGEQLWVEFENIQMPIPVKYHEALVSKYGESYMTPKKFTSAHGYPAYKDQLELFENYVAQNNTNIESLIGYC